MADTPPPTRRHRTWPWLLALVLAAMVLAVAGGGIWLATTSSGLEAAARLAGRLSGGRLTLAPGSGRLAGPLQLNEVLWQDKGLTLRIRDVALDWSPADLRYRRLEILRLTAAAVTLESPPGERRPQPPASLRLPLPVTIGALRIGRLERNGKVLAEALAGRLDSDGLNHRLTGLEARSRLLTITGEGEIRGESPYPLVARASVGGSLRDHPFALALSAGGTLTAMEVKAQGSGALQGEATARLTPFADQPFSRLQVHLRGMDPAAWVKGAPAALLDLDADLLPRPARELAVSGPFTLTNRRPAPLDAKGVPVARLTGQVAWQGREASFSSLTAYLRGKGRLTGSGQLKGSELQLRLQARAVDAAALHTRLQPTALDGPLEARIGAAGQTLTADLADRRFRLTASLARQGQKLEVESLRLAAGDALLTARGQLELGKTYPFAATGDLAGFDPGRFIKSSSLPLKASLNARFSARGSLQPRPRLALQFQLRDSRFQGQPLAGGGDLDLDWPAVRRADLSLQGGPNRLAARGAFGRPGDRLQVSIDAPRLDPYGIAGGLQGELRLAGTPANPALWAKVQSSRLGLPGGISLEGLALDADVGPQPGDPLRLDLRLAALATPDRPGALRDLVLTMAGSRARHDLAARARLDRDNGLALAARGGLGEGSGALLWQGELTELAFTPRNRDHALRLLEPTPLRLGAAEWALGPALVRGPEWQGRLRASARDGRLAAEASGRGPRLGTISARLEARLQGAWHLAADAPWQGRLDLAAADIAWIGPLIGEDWHTAGSLQGALALAGTPAHPRLAGRMAGERLGLRIAGQGLRLENGRLAAAIEDNRLRLSTLEADSVLTPLPRPLLRAAGPELDELVARPGRLTAQGEISLDPGAPEGAAGGGVLDFRLDRVGAYQQPDQWLLVSGKGRLTWHNGALGLEGRVEADAGYWELARSGMPKLSEDVVVRRTATAAPQPRRRKLELDMEADLGRHFHFAGVGLETRLAGNLKLTEGGGGLPRAAGTIRTVRGQFDAYGQKLEVERGILNFQGFVDNPSLNVRAVRRDRPVEVGVEVTGRVKKPVVRLFSDPDLPDAEKLSWLVLGHGSEQIGGNDASALLGAAGELLGNQPGGGVMRQLQRRFGLEDIGLRQGAVGDTSNRPATSRVARAGSFEASSPAVSSQIVSISKRISANAVLSYEQALGRAENIVRLTVNLSRRLSLVGRTGSDNALDLFYTFSFGR